MKVLQTNNFKKTVKKLQPNQKRDLDKAIKKLINQPSLGSLKSGDLKGVRVYKFKLLNQLALLAYTCSGKTFILLAFGGHENFYRNLKKYK